MPKFRPSDDEPFDSAAGNLRDGILLGLVLLTIIPGAAAAEQSFMVNPGSHPEVRQARGSPRPQKKVITAPGSLFAPVDLSAPVFSATDFRPRKHTVFDPDPAMADDIDQPMLRGTTVWQRMSDYRSHDRVRLLTLWQSGGSAVSLQAGKRGDPSLQWTSTLMSRDGATRGLLDRLFSVSIAGAGDTLRKVTRSSGAAPPKQVEVPAVAGLK